MVAGECFLLRGFAIGLFSYIGHWLCLRTVVTCTVLSFLCVRVVWDCCLDAEISVCKLMGGHSCVRDRNRPKHVHEGLSAMDGGGTIQGRKHHENTHS
jgi:hypothetical protein